MQLRTIYLVVLKVHPTSSGTILCVVINNFIPTTQATPVGNGRKHDGHVTMESMELTGGGVGLDATNHRPAHAWNKQDTIPDDPIAAETHYTEVSERRRFLLLCCC